MYSFDVAYNPVFGFAERSILIRFLYQNGEK